MKGLCFDRYVFIPTAETAIAVAEAVLNAVYGKDQIESEHPFKAVLKDCLGMFGS